MLTKGTITVKIIDLRIYTIFEVKFQIKSKAKKRVGRLVMKKIEGFILKKLDRHVVFVKIED